MKYLIAIKGTTFYLTPLEWDELEKAIAFHNLRGYQDGETRTPLVVITECGDNNTSRPPMSTRKARTAWLKVNKGEVV